ncbi:MAG: nitric oxide synthase oxygenase [Deinococcaceae bacterium]
MDLNIPLQWPTIENDLFPLYQEAGLLNLWPQRQHDIEQELAETGTYTHTPFELTQGSKVAWRNSTRCIGRGYWKSLVVRDCRHLETPKDIYSALVDHLVESFRRGKIRSTLSLFSPKKRIRLWNDQLIRYAGYTQDDGTVIGDPQNAALTQKIIHLGWRPKGGRFDVLPLVLEVDGYDLEWFELPRCAVQEVPLAHPEFAWFETLQLKWHAIPAIGNLSLRLGGLNYFSPFNGFYMGTEIGSRNFGDTKRYNMLPVIAQHLGLDTQYHRSLWKDRAMLELNVAVLHSFEQVGIRMVDHHSACEHFIRFEASERRLNREVFGRWSWLVPPLSSSSTEVFHRTYIDDIKTPNFFHWDDI